MEVNFIQSRKMLQAESEMQALNHFSPFTHGLDANQIFLQMQGYPFMKYDLPTSHLLWQVSPTIQNPILGEDTPRNKISETILGCFSRREMGKSHSESGNPCTWMTALYDQFIYSFMVFIVLHSSPIIAFRAASQSYFLAFVLCIYHQISPSVSAPYSKMLILQTTFQTLCILLPPPFNDHCTRNFST